MLLIKKKKKKKKEEKKKVFSLECLFDGVCAKLPLVPKV
jgi:hypothetical protein